MAKKVIKIIKLQIPAGQANPAPPVGPALGQHGVNIMDFCKAFNAQTQGPNSGQITPVEISVYEEGPLVHVHHQDAARGRADQGGAEPEVRLRRAQPHEGGVAEPGPASLDRRAQASRPQRQRRRGRNEHHRRHRPVDGRGGSLMAGKRYIEARSSVDREKAYPPRDAVRLLKSLDTAKFDETVEVHFRLGVNVRHADQQLRGTLFLPHGLGKTVTVAVFAQGEKAKEAEDAGADFVGGEDLATRINEGWIISAWSFILSRSLRPCASRRAQPGIIVGGSLGSRISDHGGLPGGVHGLSDHIAGNHRLSAGFSTYVSWATGQEPFVLASASARQGWLIAHISLIFAGYAALVLSFSASLIYLIQERMLKANAPAGCFRGFRHCRSPMTSAFDLCSLASRS